MKITRSQLRQIIKEVLSEEWKGWKPDMPVQLVGVQEAGSKYKITPNGLGAVSFSNLKEAQKHFPELDPKRGSKNFTWAMHGSLNGKTAIRFETWAANDMYSR